MRKQKRSNIQHTLCQARHFKNCSIGMHNINRPNVLKCVRTQCSSKRASDRPNVCITHHDFNEEAKEKTTHRELAQISEPRSVFSLTSRFRFTLLVRFRISYDFLALIKVNLRSRFEYISLHFG